VTAVRKPSSLLSIAEYLAGEKLAEVKQKIPLPEFDTDVPLAELYERVVFEPDRPRV
jgi:hypothetical protein